MLADMPEEVTRQLHVTAQARESSPVVDRRSNHCATTALVWKSVCVIIRMNESLSTDASPSTRTPTRTAAEHLGYQSTLYW